MLLRVKNCSRHRLVSVGNRSLAGCVLAVVMAILMTIGQSASASDESGSGNTVSDSAVSEEESVEPVSDILIVLDATASMEYRTGSIQGATRLDLARLVTANVLDVAPTGINLGVLTLRDDVSELRPLEPLAASDRTQIRSGVDTLVPFGNGDLVECFERIGSRLKPESSPLVVMVTDGDGYNSEAANLAAGKLHDKFGDRLRFVLVGICKQGEIADRLRTLASSAGGDSISLISENGIPTGLASVRQACEEVRRYRKREFEQLEKHRDTVLAELLQVQDELTDIEHAHRQLKITLDVSLNKQAELQDDIAKKTDQIHNQAGKIETLTGELDKAVTSGATSTRKLAVVEELHRQAAEQLGKSTGTLKKLTSENEANKERLTLLSHDLDKQQIASKQYLDELTGFKNSWVAPFAPLDSFWVFAVLMILLGGPSGSKAIFGLVAAKFGLPFGDSKVLDGLTHIDEEHKKAQSSIDEQLKQVSELATQKFEETRQQVSVTEELQKEAGRHLAEISNATTRQFNGVTETVAASFNSLEGVLANTEAKVVDRHNVLLKQMDVSKEELSKQTVDLKAVLDAQSEKISGQVECVGERSAVNADAITRDVVNAVNNLGSQVAGKLDQSTTVADANHREVIERLDKHCSDADKHSTSLQAAVNSQAASQREMIKDTATTTHSQLQAMERSAIERLEINRAAIADARSDVAQVRETLRQDVNDSAEETIRRVAEVSEIQVGPISEAVRETRDGLREQGKLTTELTNEIRGSIDQMSNQVDQLPLRLETSGNQISAAITQELRHQLNGVQATIQAVRDQVKNQLEAGLNESKQQQVEHSVRLEQLNKELARVEASCGSLGDAVKFEAAAVTASLKAELKDANIEVVDSLKAIESELQAVAREVERLKEAGDSGWLEKLTRKIDQLQVLIELFQSYPTNSESRKPVHSDVESAPKDASEEDAPSQSDPCSEPASERQHEPKGEPLPDVDRGEVLELSKLPGLGEKSAEQLVRMGINSIHELAHLSDEQKGRVEEKGRLFKKIDEWIISAKKVRMLQEDHGVSFKEAIRFTKLNSWPEGLRQLPVEEIRRLSSEYSGFADWLSQGPQELDDGSSSADPNAD